VLQPLHGLGGDSPEAEDDTKLLLGKERTATLGSSIINLTNTIIGAGMLGLPYAVSVCGLAFGLTMLVLRSVPPMHRRGL
jgi:hypothetical protein